MPGGRRVIRGVVGWLVATALLTTASSVHDNVGPWASLPLVLLAAAVMATAIKGPPSWWRTGEGEREESPRSS